MGSITSRPSLLQLLAVIFTVLYPAIVYVGLTRWDGDHVRWLLIALVLLSVLLRLRIADRKQLASILKVPLLIAAISIAALVIPDDRLLRAVPTLANALLAISFYRSLATVPMIERYATVIHQRSLPPEESRYCRKVTRYWVVFFVANASITLGVTLTTTLATWALYTGVVTWVLVAIGLGVEFIIRRRRFQHFTSAWYDRLLTPWLRRSTVPEMPKTRPLSGARQAQVGDSDE